MEVEAALDKFVEILTALGYKPKAKPCYSLTNGAFATAVMKGEINLEDFKERYGGSYNDPEKIQKGLVYKTYSRKLTIYSSGKVKIHGAGSLDEMNTSFAEALPKIVNCMNTRNDNENIESFVK